MTTLSASFQNGHPLNGHPVNGHPVNGHPVNGHPVNGHPVHGRADGDGAFDEIDVQRARLEADIAAAMSRTVAAKERIAARDADIRAALQAELVASQATLARLEREYEMAGAMVEQAASDEVDRILAAARLRVAYVRRGPDAGEGSSDGE